MRGDERLLREQGFHDEIFASDGRSRTWPYYAAVEHLLDDYASILQSGAGDRDVLELGCGRGGQAVALAALGDRLVAVDISPVAVGITQALAARRGVRVDARQGDAHQLDLAEASFDVVCGSGVLHHVDMVRTLDEVERVLRPGGRAVFIEPLGHNPAINWFRKRTPQLRSADERPLRVADIRLIQRRFDDTAVRYGGLVTLPLALSRRTRSGRAMAVAAALERRLLRRSFPGVLAWFVLVEFRAGAIVQRRAKAT